MARMGTISDTIHIGHISKYSLLIVSFYFSIIPGVFLQISVNLACDFANCSPNGLEGMNLSPYPRFFAASITSGAFSTASNALPNLSLISG